VTVYIDIMNVPLGRRISNGDVTMSYSFQGTLAIRKCPVHPESQMDVALDWGT
jgi:hypothetical protein